MRRTLAFLLILAGMLAAVPIPTAIAADQGTGCPSDPERVRFYENAIGDTSDGDDTVIFCGLGASDLSLISHTVPGVCKSHNLRIGDNDSWNDCISSLYPIIPAGRLLCLYGQANFVSGGSYVTAVYYHSDSGHRINLSTGTFGMNDGMSSWHFLDDGPQFLGC